MRRGRARRFFEGFSEPYRLNPDEWIEAFDMKSGVLNLATSFEPRTLRLGSRIYRERFEQTLCVTPDGRRWIDGQTKTMKKEILVHVWKWDMGKHWYVSVSEPGAEDGEGLATLYKSFKTRLEAEEACIAYVLEYCDEDEIDLRDPSMKYPDWWDDRKRLCRASQVSDHTH